MVPIYHIGAKGMCLMYIRRKQMNSGGDGIIYGEQRSGMDAKCYTTQ